MLTRRNEMSSCLCCCTAFLRLFSVKEFAIAFLLRHRCPTSSSLLSRLAKKLWIWSDQGGAAQQSHFHFTVCSQFYPFFPLKKQEILRLQQMDTPRQRPLRVLQMGWGSRWSNTNLTATSSTPPPSCFCHPFSTLPPKWPCSSSHPQCHCHHSKRRHCSFSSPSTFLYRRFRASKS